MFTNGLGDQGSVLGQVIPKTQKVVLDASSQHYKAWIMRKWSTPKKRVVSSPAPQYSSY